MWSIIQLLEQEITLLQPFYFSIFTFLIFDYFLIKWLTSHPATPGKQPPPSPPKLPVLGNLHQLGTLLYRPLLSLSERYGRDLMLLYFGSKPVLIVSSSTAAREIMKTHGLAFAGRPKLKTMHKLLYNSKDVVGAPYGEYWRKMRSVCVVHLLSNKSVHSYRTIREEEINLLVERIKQFSSKSLPINLSQMLSHVTHDVISRIAFGRKYRGENGAKFEKLLGEFMRLLGSSNVGDFIPWLGWINWINGFDGDVDRTAKELDEFLDGIVEEHVSSLESIQEKEEKIDFVHVLLQLQQEYNMAENSLEIDSIKALILDIFAGGADTSSTVLEWAMTELIRNPRVMKELQNIVNKITNQKSTIITETDLEKMHYLKLVIKETLRLHTPFPLLAPRETTKDITVMGYHISAGTMVFTNAWAIARDPQTWEKPEEFWPERFVNSNIDFKGHEFEFIPFGAGRRICPGVSFAMHVVELVLANLVKNFEWELLDGVKGEDLDIDESFVFTARRKNPLLALAIPSSI